jgi:DNA polymerase-3 subunit delta
VPPGGPRCGERYSREFLNMTPQQFLTQIRQKKFPPACLLLGPETYQRDYCRRALIEAFLPQEERETGLTRYDLEETSLETVLEDACTLTLFAPRRVILVRNAEAALPKGRAASGAESEGEEGGSMALARYLRRPTEGVVLVFEAAKYAPEGEDKARFERVRKFYSAVPAIVECLPLRPEQARQLAASLARKANLPIQDAELDLLVEALGADAARIAAEIEKLSLWVQGGGSLGPAEMARLVPEARSANIFELSDALAARDRLRALEVLDVLVRQSEYLPLALASLSSQLRLALAARQAGWKRPEQIQTEAARLGVRMWPERARQIFRTASAFPKEQLVAALRLVHEADRALRDARPDDRIPMESFIFRLTR